MGRAGDEYLLGNGIIYYWHLGDSFKLFSEAVPYPFGPQQIRGCKGYKWTGLQDLYLKQRLLH